jgi:hypothetical protein
MVKVLVATIVNKLSLLASLILSTNARYRAVELTHVEIWCFHVQGVTLEKEKGHMRNFSDTLVGVMTSNNSLKFLPAFGLHRTPFPLHSKGAA